MNFVLRLLSPLFFNLLRRFGPQLPGIDPVRIARGKRRLGAALLFGALSLILFTTGLLLTMVDLAIQYEQHGEFTWNAILWISVSLLGAGVASAMGAKSMMPGIRDFVALNNPDRGASVEAPAAGSALRPPRRPEYAH